MSSHDHTLCDGESVQLPKFSTCTRTVPLIPFIHNIHITGVATI